MDFCDECGGVLEVGKSICKSCGTISQCQEDNTVPEEIKDKWQGEQDQLKKKMSLEDTEKVKALKRDMEAGSNNVHYIGGVDISFVKGDNVNACSALVICNYPDLEVVYEDYEMIKLTQPYIPGYLAFREVDFLVSLFEKLKQTEPQYIPEVILVDGNGLLHPKEFGLACHLGVLLDTPCIGVAKKLFQVDGLEKNVEHTDKIKQLKQGGDTFPLVGESKKTLGMTLRSCDSSTNPVYVSPGHQISLETAVMVTYKCCKHRIPEPVRKADINSREYLRVDFKPET